MNLLLFAGNSTRNKSWIYEVRDELRPFFESVIVHDYAHWYSDQSFIDFDIELSKLREEFTPSGPYTVLAKSVGTILTSQAIHAGILDPQQCIFLGLPLKLIEANNYPLAAWLRDYHQPVTCIQNDGDPLGSYADMKDFIVRTHLGQCLCVELPGHTHDYHDLERLKQIVALLLKDQQTA